MEFASPRRFVEFTCQCRIYVSLKYTEYLIFFSFYLSSKGRNDRIPDIIAQRTSKVNPVHPTIIPSVDNAVQMYTAAGGTITRECSFGIDPLANDGIRTHRRDIEFTRDNPPFHEIYSNVINGDGSLMKSAVLSFINITTNLSP